jgi:hypothetical protein
MISFQKRWSNACSFLVPYLRSWKCSPNSRQLAYTTQTKDDNKMYICNIPPGIRPVYAFSLNMYRLCANIPSQNIARQKANLDHLLHVRISSSYDTTHSLLSLQSRATRPPVGYRRRPMSAIPIVPRHPPKRNPQHPAFSRLTKLLHFCADAVPVRHIQPRVQPHDPLDVCFFRLLHSYLTQHSYYSFLPRRPYPALSRDTP